MANSPGLRLLLLGLAARETGGQERGKKMQLCVNPLTLMSTFIELCAFRD